MVETLTRAIIILSIIGLIVFMSLSSFIFGTKDENTTTLKIERKVETYRSKVREMADKSYTYLDKEKITDNSLTLANSETLYIEFGRLASAMFTSETNTLDSHILTLSGRSIIALKEYPGIISLYDPFETYSYESSIGDYRIQQMTNGSFYIGREKDGTISLYSIDAVIRLEFLHEKNKMTDMILFPGMYVRFDPTLNRTLAGADLFRVILSMVSTSSDPEAVDRTGVEFVNPRITSSGDSDTFFMYRLPIYTRILFRSLHAEFAGRIKKLEDLKKYATDFTFDMEQNERDSLLSNPAKKNHFLLRELEGLLSQIVDQSKTKEDFIKALTKIKKESEDLADGNDVERTLEEFLTDARFASFQTTRNLHFQEIYDEIAGILKIAPKGAKAELLQKLSNIYSLNLSAQMKDKEFSRIDTYSPTAREIMNTLSSKEIDSKDYFDIALYAYHVLKKAENGGKYFDEAVTANATYDLLRTIFLATDKYVKSVGDNTAFKSLSIQFYDHTLSTLINSLYDMFTEVEEERIFLKSKFVTDNVVTLSDKVFIDNIRNIDGVIEYLFDFIKKAYENESDLRTYLSIQKNKTRLHAFVKLFEKGYYSEYLETPYVAVKVDGLYLPELTPDSEDVVSAKRDEKISKSDIPEDPAVIGIRNLLGNIPNTNIIRENEGYYQVKNAALETVNPNDSTTMKYELSATFTQDLTTISNISLLYNDKRIVIVTDTRDQTVLGNLEKLLPAYLITIDDIFRANPSQILRGEIKFYIDKSRIVIGTNIFNLQ